MASSHPSTHPELRHRVVVLGGSARTLDLLRLAAIGSDDVVLIAPSPDAAVRRFADQFAIEIHDRPARHADVGTARAVLIAIGDVRIENELVREARRRRVPVHVADRGLVSDFSMLDLLEQRPLAA